MADRIAFSFYRSYFEAACTLNSKEEQADYLMAICEYMFNEEIPPITGAPLGMFKLTLPSLENTKKRAKSGSVGGKKKLSKSEAEFNQNESRSEAKCKQTESELEAINEYMINENMINEDIPPISPPKLKNWELQFEEFWKEYPRKVGKGAAKRAFEKVIKSMTLETLVTAVRRQKCGSQWTKDNGQFIPHPATWLNQARWEDEVDGGVVNDGNRNATTGRNWNLHTDI